jgi:sulfate transport system ATP-binding protein
MVKRVVHLGFEVRLELELPDGSEARAQLTRQQADELELGRGDIVYARPPAGVPIDPELRGSVSRERDSAEPEVPAAAYEEPG